MTFSEILLHIWIYHSVHCILVFGIVFVMEIDRRYKKGIDNNHKLDYIGDI
jgi:hypothetical protein